MAKNFLHIAWAIFLLLAGPSASSQQPVSAKATADRNKILIGEPLQLLLEVNVAEGAAVTWIPLDTIPHFEFVERGKIDSSNTGAAKSFRQRLVLTSFDSGSRVIPPLQFIVDSKKYYTDSIPVEVGFSSFDPKQDYHDIKDIIPVDNPYVHYIVWIIAALILLSLALVIYFIRGKRVITETGEQPESRWSPYEEAVRSLAELKQQHLPENGQVKLYYTRLNDILRLFVMRKLRMASMDKTNEELIIQLRQVNISPQQFSQLAEALRMSDYVKFAKFQPGEDDNERNFKIIETSVHLLNEIEQ